MKIHIRRLWSLFGNPGYNRDGGNFGVVTGASGERQLRFGLRFQF